MGFNKIILEGRLTKDVELRYSNSGMAMAKGSIAVGKKFTSNGEKKEKTLFINLQFWQRSAEIFNQYCKKGSHILVEGELENQNWTDNKGNKRYDFVINVSSMQMLDTKQSSQQTGANAPVVHEQVPQQEYKPQNNGNQVKQTEVPSIEIDESEIPF